MHANNAHLIYQQAIISYLFQFAFCTLWNITHTNKFVCCIFFAAAGGKIAREHNLCVNVCDGQRFREISIFLIAHQNIERLHHKYISIHLVFQIV